MTLIVDGVDLSPYLAVAKYDTGLTPVVALEYTDTDGVIHRSIKRWRATLSGVKFRILKNHEALFIGYLLTANPTHTVRYTHATLGTVTHEMIIDEVGNTFLPSNDNSLYWSGKELSFTQR